MSDKPQAQGAPGNSAFFAAVVITAIAAAGLWLGARPLVVTFLYAPAWVELHIIDLTIGLGDTGRQFLEYVTAVFDGRVNPWTVYWADVSTVLTLVGGVMRWPFAAIIVVYAFIVAIKMKGEGFARRFSLASVKKGDISFMQYQSQLWKLIKPAIHYNPNEYNNNEAPARTPLEWCRDHEIEPIQDNLGGSITLPIEETEAAFVKQLGKPWPGLLKAPVHVQIIAVLAALNYNDSKSRTGFGKSAAEVMSTPMSAAKRKAAVQELLKPHLANKALVRAVDTIASKHYYTTTVMCKLYDWSRDRNKVHGSKGASLPSAEVRWVKKIDRSLWYAINNMGRLAFHVEGGGIIAHYFAECVNNDRLDSPYVLPAIEGLQANIDASGIVDIDAYFRESDAFQLAERELEEEALLEKARSAGSRGRRKRGRLS